MLARRDFRRVIQTLAVVNQVYLIGTREIIKILPLLNQLFVLGRNILLLELSCSLKSNFVSAKYLFFTILVIPFDQVTSRSQQPMGDYLKRNKGDASHIDLPP